MPTVLFHLMIFAAFFGSAAGGTITAKAVVLKNDIYTAQSVSDPVLGVVTFEQEEGRGQKMVKVTGTLKGLTPGKHGFHIHDLGNVEGGCSSASSKIFLFFHMQIFVVVVFTLYT